jgi:hypothetical protein
MELSAISTVKTTLAVTNMEAKRIKTQLSKSRGAITQGMHINPLIQRCNHTKAAYEHNREERRREQLTSLQSGMQGYDKMQSRGWRSSRETTRCRGAGARRRCEAWDRGA